MFTEEDRQEGLQTRRKRQATHDRACGERIAALRAEGTGWRAICRRLEAEGFTTASGNSRWQPVQAQRIAQRWHAEASPTGWLERLWTRLRPGPRGRRN